MVDGFRATPGRGLAAHDVDRANLARDVVEVAARLRARIAPGLVQENAVLPHGGQPEAGRVSTNGVDPGPRGKKGRRRVDSVWAPAQVLAKGAFDGRELEAEIVACQRPARLFRPADIVDTVERHVVEQRGGVGAARQREQTERQGQGAPDDTRAARHVDGPVYVGS